MATNTIVERTLKGKARGPQPDTPLPDPKKIKFSVDLAPPRSGSGDGPQYEPHLASKRDSREHGVLKDITNTGTGTRATVQSVHRDRLKPEILSPASDLTCMPQDTRNEEAGPLAQLQASCEAVTEAEVKSLSANKEEQCILPLFPLIVNPGDKLNWGSVYFPPHVANKLLGSQIEGIQFLWREVVQKGEGALLAHTMGMGKTLQVIILLYLISETNNSISSKVPNQVCEHLRGALHVLVVAPPGLLSNWKAEFMKWIPKTENQKLLKFYVPGNLKSSAPRIRMLREWKREGGVLLIGYQMLRGYALESRHQQLQQPDNIKVSRRRGTRASTHARESNISKLEAEDKDNRTENNSNLTPEQVEVIISAAEARSIVLETPNIVIADEAHAVKNQISGLSEALGRITTTSRIALTGSPLANNLSEYYCLIKWVSGDMLGPKRKFDAFFTKPIEDGLYEDSLPCQKVVALRRLAVLRHIMSAKMNRCGLSRIKHRLPEKTEFLIIVELTDIQRKIYDLFVRNVVRENDITGAKDQEKLEIRGFFDHVGCLRTLLNHPKILLDVFKERARRKAKKGDLDIGANLAKSLSRSTINEIRDEDLLGDAHLKTLVNLCKHDQTIEDFEAPIHSNRMACLFIVLELAEKIREKLLVFSTSIPTLDYIQDSLDTKKIKCHRIDGSTKPKDRQQLISSFESRDGANIMLISTKAGGVGLNITAASRIIIFDFDFSPQDEEQAIARAYRLGQTKPVFVYRFKVGGTHEDKIHNKSVHKISIASRVVDGSSRVRLAKRGRAREYFNPPGQCEKGDLTPFRQNYTDPLLLGLLDSGLVQKVELQDTDMYVDRTEGEVTEEEKGLFERDLDTYNNDYQERDDRTVKSKDKEEAPHGNPDEGKLSTDDIGPEPFI